MRGCSRDRKACRIPTEPQRNRRKSSPAFSCNGRNADRQFRGVRRQRQRSFSRHLQQELQEKHKSSVCIEQCSPRRTTRVQQGTQEAKHRQGWRRRRERRCTTGTVAVTATEEEQREGFPVATARACRQTFLSPPPPNGPSSRHRRAIPSSIISNSGSEKQLHSGLPPAPVTQQGNAARRTSTGSRRTTFSSQSGSGRSAGAAC